MSNILITFLCIFGYIILAGITGGLCVRLGWIYDCCITLAAFCPVGIILVLIAIIWRWVAAEPIWQKDRDIIKYLQNKQKDE